MLLHLWILSKLTALSKNTQILKSKRQLTYEFFTAINHLSRPLRKQKFTPTGSKGHGLWFVIAGFWSVLCISVFQVSLLVIVIKKIMTDSSEKHNCEGGFGTSEFMCFWKAQWRIAKHYETIPHSHAIKTSPCVKSGASLCL